MFTFRSRLSFVWLALAVAAVIVSALWWDNRAYLFHAKIFETGDWASDSLFVREAKQGWLLHGHYSRWVFYHPGPALFATLAAGEAIFYDWLRIVPTPLNGQMMALCVTSALFFSFALSVFARRLGTRGGGCVFFLPLALLFAAFHYAALNGAGAFLETWPACPPLLVFLCLLVASASVASGGGSELPLLVLAGGWLVHNHVAQPLFVVPLTLLAYAGLVISCRRGAVTPPAGERRGIGAALGAGWRAFPRLHVAAGVLLALFILPLLLDALHGRDSNLARILAHLHRHHEPPKKLMRSLCYFLTFGSYDVYKPGEGFFGRYSAAGMLAFVELHWRAYGCWLLTLVAPPGLFFWSRRRSLEAEATGDEPMPNDAPKFIRWFYAVLAIAFALTLVWGMKQDGDMFYFNAYFNYSIYYGAALGLAAALSVALYRLTAAPGRVGARVAIATALWLGVAAAAVAKAPRFLIHDGDTPTDRAAAESVAQAAAATLPPGVTCYLSCDPWDAWPETVGAALQLERLGYRFRVDDNWSIMFGERHTISHDPMDVSHPIVRWKILPVSADPSHPGRWPLQQGYGIKVEETHDIDPASGDIRFAVQGNFGDYAIFGWAPTTADWTWSDERAALLAFRPLPLPGGAGEEVEVSIGAWSYQPPGVTARQRMEVSFDGRTLATVLLPIFQGAPPPIRLRIPAADWQAAAARGRGQLLFRFPDAKPPANTTEGADLRPLGGGFHDVQFRLAEKSAAKPGDGVTP